MSLYGSRLGFGGSNPPLTTNTTNLSSSPSNSIAHLNMGSPYYRTATGNTSASGDGDTAEGNKLQSQLLPPSSAAGAPTGASTTGGVRKGFSLRFGNSSVNNPNGNPHTASNASSAGATADAMSLGGTANGRASIDNTSPSSPAAANGTTQQRSSTAAHHHDPVNGASAGSVAANTSATTTTNGTSATSPIRRPQQQSWTADTTFNESSAKASRTTSGAGVYPYANNNNSTSNGSTTTTAAAKRAVGAYAAGPPSPAPSNMSASSYGGGNTPSAQYDINNSVSAFDAFTETEIRYFRKVFETFDTNKTGSLGLYETSAMCRHLGVEVSMDELRASIDAIDANGNGTLEFGEFMQWLAEMGGGASTSRCISRTASMTSTSSAAMRGGGGGDSWAIVKSKIRARGAKPITNDQIETYREIFEHLDADNSGTIGLEELRDVYASMGQHDVTDAEILSLIEEVDDNNSGEIDFDEFLLLMCMGFTQAGGGMGDDGMQSIEQYLRASLAKYDPNGYDYISVEELREMMYVMVMGEMSALEIEEVIAMVPKDDHGRVCYQQWTDLWMACQSTAGSVVAQ